MGGKLSRQEGTGKRKSLKLKSPKRAQTRNKLYRKKPTTAVNGKERVIKEGTAESGIVNALTEEK